MLVSFVNLFTYFFPAEVVSDEIVEREEFLSSEFQSPEQISRDLITMSTLPGTRWKNLLLLDVIKV